MNASASWSVHAPVCWGRALTLLIFTHHPAKHTALRFPPCQRTAWLPLLIKQPVMGWVIWPIPEGSSDPGNAVLRQRNKTRIQAKNSRKGWRNSRMRLRVRDIWAICTRQPKRARAWAQVLAQHHPAAQLSVQSLAQTCPTATSSPSHNAWALFSNSQGPFPIHSLDGPPCWGGRGREFMVKSHDARAGLGASEQFPGLLFTSVEVILNTTIHSAQRSSQNGHCLLLGLPLLLQHSGLSFFVFFCSLRYFCRFYLISPVFMHCLGWFLIDQKIRWMHLLGQSTISPWSGPQTEIVDCISKQQSTILQNPPPLSWSFCPWI